MAGCFDFVAALARPFERAVHRTATARPAAWLALVVAVAALLSLFSKFPSYATANTRFPGNFVEFAATPYGRAIAWWLDHPFQPVPAEAFFPATSRADPLITGSISHCDKLTFRAFLPLLNQLTRGGVWTLFAANHVATLLTFFLIFRICVRATGDPVLATLATWAYAASWAGTWGFNDMVCGDAVAIALLLAAMALRPGSWGVAALMLAAGFTDERAICAAPLVALLRWWMVQAPCLEPRPAFSARQAWRATAPVFAGLAAYAACRLYVMQRFGIHASTSMMASPEILLYHVYVSYPIKFFSVFEFLWAFPLLLLLHLAAAGRTARGQLLAFAAGLLGAATPALLVWDLNRSLCYLLPGVIGALCYGPGAIESRRRLTILVAVAGLFWLEPNVSALRFFVF